MLNKINNTLKELTLESFLIAGTIFFIVIVRMIHIDAKERRKIEKQLGDSINKKDKYYENK